MHRCVSFGGKTGTRMPVAGFVGLGVCVLLLGVGPLRATAQERFYVLPDGSRFSLIPSDTEIGVVFQPGRKSAAAAKRMAASKLGVLRDLEFAPDSNIKILRVDSVSMARTRSIIQDPDVRTAGRVYRFAGSPVPVIATRRIVLKLRPEMTQEQRENLFAAYRLVRVAPLEGLHDVYVVTVVDDTVDEVLLAERLADDPMTLWANPDFIRLREKRQAPPPADEFFADQWHLNNTGQTEGTVGADIDVLAAWDIADGEGVLFGMFDDSCDVDHEDLRSRYIGVGHDASGLGGCTDFCLSANDGICSDGGTGTIGVACLFGTDCTDCGVRPENDPRPRAVGDAHGTAVMGLAVAAANNVGVRGVAHAARFTVSRGMGEGQRNSQTASVYVFAMEQGVDVHINSWGYVISFPIPPVVVDSLETAFLEGRDLDGPGGEDPLGMVILFATGNQAVENEAGLELSELPTVIGIGASDDDDRLATFSSYGRGMSVIAPGQGGIVTTDTQDGVYPGNGYNFGGISNDIDPGGNYTGTFGGTSSACPIAAGVAGLVLSVNPNLTATDVRLLLEHTADRISPDDADYNGISGKSLKFGFGRINAHRAVLAAQESLLSGNQTWPNLPSDVRVQSTTLSWNPGINTTEFLVLESLLDFAFIPEDELCYDAEQEGCSVASLQPLPDSVTVLDVVGDCGGDCPTDQIQSTEFDNPSGAKKFFGLYGRSSSGKYSFGFAADSTGDFSGGAAFEDRPPPAITIVATPIAGESPLVVQFNGNAVSELELDPTKTAWDFDFDPDVGFAPDASAALASHTYTAGPGETKLFNAVLRMTDVRGVSGQNIVRIRVTGPVATAPVDAGQLSNLKLIVESPMAPDDDRCQGTVCGTAPFSVVFDLVNDISQDPVSIETLLWDLGDGAISSTQSVFHTFSNTGDLTLVLPVTVTVKTLTATGIPQTSSLTQLVTVLPGSSSVGDDGPKLPGTTPGGGDDGSGGSASPCGVLGMIPLLLCFGAVLFRRLRFVSIGSVRR